MSRHELTSVLRVLADGLRLRLLHLLTTGECSVGELSTALNARQSLVSTQLARLDEEFAVQTRREGRSVLRHAPADAQPSVVQAVLAEHALTREARTDRDALERCVRRRGGQEAPESLGAGYLPGRSWESFARALLQLVPALDMADIGVGSGEMTLLLAAHARSMVAVDKDPAALTRLAAKARRAKVRIDCRLGDAGNPPLPAASLDVVILSQLLHELEDPQAAVRAAARALRPGGRMLILELQAHQETWVRRRLGHCVLGFTERELLKMLQSAGLRACTVQRAARDAAPPHFVALLASAEQRP